MWTPGAARKSVERQGIRAPGHQGTRAPGHQGTRAATADQDGATKGGCDLTGSDQLRSARESGKMG